jgi:hypothetical protein
MTEQSAVAARHELKLETHGRRFHVIECTCGWSSPLCPSAGRAEQLFNQHRAAHQSGAAERL